MGGRGRVGRRLRDAVDELLDSGDAPVRDAGAKLRRLVLSAVLDWRGALAGGTLVAQGRLRRLALDRAAATDDVDLLARLVALGCDPAEEVRAGLTPIDVALLHRSAAVRDWLLDRRVPVANTLRVGVELIDADLAGQLLARGALVDAATVAAALRKDDATIAYALAQAVPPDADLRRLGPQLRQLAAQAALAGRWAVSRSDAPAAAAEQRRAEMIMELADRFDPDGRRPVKPRND